MTCHDFKSKKTKKLPYVDEDRAHMHAVLSKLGYKIYSLTANPTVADTTQALHQVCADLKPEDQFVFYGSSHGHTTKQGQPAILCHDGILALGDVIKTFEKKECRLIFIIDACRTVGKAGEGKEGWSRAIRHVVHVLSQVNWPMFR